MELNSFPSKFINKPFSFVMRLNRMNALAACCHFSIFIGSFLYQLAKPPQGTVLFINLLGTGSTSRTCMGDGGSIWCAPCATFNKLRSILFLLKLQATSPEDSSKSSFFSTV